MPDTVGAAQREARLRVKYRRAAVRKVQANAYGRVENVFVPTGAHVEYFGEEGAMVEVHGRIWVGKREMAEVKLDGER